MQILGTDNGEMVEVFNSKWRYPDTLGYTKDDPQWAKLQRLYMEYTGSRIDEDGNDIPIEDTCSKYCKAKACTCRRNGNEPANQVPK